MSCLEGCVLIRVIMLLFARPIDVHTDWLVQYHPPYAALGLFRASTVLLH